MVLNLLQHRFHELVVLENELIEHVLSPLHQRELQKPHHYRQFSAYSKRSVKTYDINRIDALSSLVLFPLYPVTVQVREQPADVIGATGV